MFDALTVLATTRQPASAAAGVLGALNEAARSNQSIARAAAAESRGLRVQALILAVVIPALFLYLVVTNRELVAPVLDTPVRRFDAPAGGRPARGCGDRPLVARDPAGGRVMDATPLGALAVGLAAFCLLMAVFAPWLAVPARDDAVRAVGLPRERYARLVSAERPAWGAP
ncbi:MAG: hypothetical protein U0838_02415 [Chloroflexota bacterium]